MAKEDLITILDEHYKDAKGILESQSPAFDKRIDLYRGHIDSSKWPYKAKVFDPRVSTVINNKTSRLFAQPPRGTVHPREGSDVASAKVVNELLNFQWDQATHFNGTMVEKFMLMDQWTRIYGASFALVKWHRIYDSNGKVKFDGPEMQVLRNVDCLPDPRATSIEDANWFQVVEYTTLDDLEATSNTKGRPIYKNLGELKAKMQKEGIDQNRDSRFRTRNLELWGIDESTTDPAFRRLRIVTEYRKDKWITFSPDFSVILREIDNPYAHGEIPIIMLRYYPLGDALYGLSEVEPIAKLQRGINALINQYFDLTNTRLHPPVHVNPAEVRMHTLEWGVGKIWEMDRPNVSAQIMELPEAGLATFQSVYSLLVASLNNAVGEQSVGISNLGVFNPEKTATEIADIASIRNARDVNNALHLGETIKRQMMMWIEMDKEFVNTPAIVRIVGRQAIERIKESKFMDTGISEVDAEAGLEPESRFEEIVTGELGEVKVLRDDLAGTYDYIPDVESFSSPNRQEITELRRTALEFMLDPAIQEEMQAKGIQPDIVNLISDLLEDSGLKDARKYFEKASVPQAGGEIVTEGAPQTGTIETEPSLQGRGILQELLGRITGR